MRKCARLPGISKTTVGAIVSMARVAGVEWVLAQTLSDDELEARVWRPSVPRASCHLDPDFALVHQQLRRPGVTLLAGVNYPVRSTTTILAGGGGHSCR